MNKIITTILLAASLCAASCEDFLTETPKHSKVMENAVTDYASVQNLVNGIYGTYENNCDYCGGYLYGMLHCMAGLWKNTPVCYSMGYTETLNNTYILNIWKQLYTLLNAANAAIAGVESLADDQYPSPQAKATLLADAHCFRAFCNLQLLWYFGHWFDKADSPYGIIYRDKVSDLSNLNVPRVTVGESYQLILDDLAIAEKDLGDYVNARHMSKQFAQALHAKLLLVRGWDGDYAEALGLVNTLLTQSPASFKMETDLAQLYEKGWDSNEVLFSRYLGDCSNRGAKEYTYAAGLHDTKTFTDIPQAWLEADPRASIIFGEAGGPQGYDADKPLTQGVLVKLYHRGRRVGPNDMYATYVCRYAELYLMKAELLARTNPSDLAGALAPLNQMRATYTNPVLEPVPMPATHQELMDAIYKEYVVTLFMENETPWFASVRFEHDGKPWIYTLKPEVTFNENHYCWPIPYDERKAHTNEIPQNPQLD